MSRPATRGAESAAALLSVGPLFRLTKVDATTGVFRAEVANETPDGTGERCDVAASLPHFAALEKRCLAESAGKKVAPLREMHQLIAAGNVTEFLHDPSGRTIGMLGKITNPDSLHKALEGTLSGVSMGGKKRYLGYDRDGTRSYEAHPKEVSLVDLGEVIGSGIEMLNAAGGFTAVLADGAEEQRLYKSYAEGLPDGEAPASLAHLVDTADHHIRHGAEHNAKAAETLDKIAEVLPVVSPEAGTELGKVRGKRGHDKPMAQAAGGEKDPEKPYGDVKYAKPAEGDEPAKYPVDTPAHIRAAWSYAHKYHESSKVLRAIIAAWKAHIDSAGPPGAMEKAIIGSVLAKNAGFDLVARTAQIVGELSYLAECQEAEEAKEGDAAAEALCAQYARAIRALGDCLVAMTVEEVDELGDEGDAGEPDGEALPMANAADAMRGLRGRMQKMHNMSVEMGAACAPPLEKAIGTTTAAEPVATEEDGMTEQELQKAVGAAVETALGLNQPTGETALQKAIGAAIGTALDVGNAESPLAKAIGSAVTASVTPQLDALRTELGARIKTLEDKPEAPKGALFALGKSADGAAGAAAENAALDTLARTNPNEFVKLMQREGGFRVTAQGLEPIAPPA